MSLRTIYRDLRTLALAGVPLLGEPKAGYSLAEGNRLPPVMFTREEATDLLTAERLAARLTDAPTTQLNKAAMDKVRALLQRTDRDYLQALTPHLHVWGPAPTATGYQQLLLASATHQVVRLRYQATATDPPTVRTIEPLGRYFSQHWHVVAYCRLREAFRNFRLDRIQHLARRPEFFTPRLETLAQHWATQATQPVHARVVLRFAWAGTLPGLVQRLHDTKRQYGWAAEQLLPDSQLEMTLFPGSLPYLAAWLLPYAPAVTVVEPPALRAYLGELAQQAYHFFCQADGNADTGRS